MFSPAGMLDRQLHYFVVTDDSLMDERKYLELESQLICEPLAKVAISTLDNVDSKTQALLAHVSMMIAVLSLFASFVITGGITKYLLIVEIIGYVIVAIGLLRCIWFIGPEMGFSTTVDEYNLKIIAETCFRRKLYLYLLTATIYITILFLVSVIAHYLASSVKFF
jgi:hypothetical protein